MALIFRNSFLPELLNNFIESDDISNSNCISEPAVNVSENNDSFLLELAVPGMKKEDIKVDVENKELKIAANNGLNGDKNNYVRREFLYGDFEKVFEMPDSVNTDEISASMENGVLTVTMPKREEAKVKPAREISIA